jgi:hypothetical protein
MLFPVPTVVIVLLETKHRIATAFMYIFFPSLASTSALLVSHWHAFGGPLGSLSIYFLFTRHASLGQSNWAAFLNFRLKMRCAVHSLYTPWIRLVSLRVGIRAAVCLAWWTYFIGVAFERKLEWFHVMLIH